MKEKTPPTMQFGLRYRADRGDMFVGYAFATRQKTSDLLRLALDEFFERHEAEITARQVPRVLD